MLSWQVRRRDKLAKVAAEGGRIEEEGNSARGKGKRISG